MFCCLFICLLRTSALELQYMAARGGENTHQKHIEELKYNLLMCQFYGWPEHLFSLLKQV